MGLRRGWRIDPDAFEVTVVTCIPMRVLVRTDLGTHQTVIRTDPPAPFGTL